MHIAENIKALRKNKGWSQSELANKLSVHLTQINRIETGKYNPSLELAAKLADLFDVPLDYLVNSGDSSLDDLKIENQGFAERIKLLNSLDDDEKFVVNKVIDSFLAKKKMLCFLKEIDNE